MRVNLSEELMMRVLDVRAAEIRVLRALRLIAQAVDDSGDDMIAITDQGRDGTPSEVREAQRAAWKRVSGILKRTRGVFTALIDDSGPAFENSMDIVAECGAGIREWEEEGKAERLRQCCAQIAENERRVLQNLMK
jgi:hypothetical protein